jgi:hypothetical protein
VARTRLPAVVMALAVVAPLGPAADSSQARSEAHIPYGWVESGPLPVAGGAVFVQEDTPFDVRFVAPRQRSRVLTEFRPHRTRPVQGNDVLHVELDAAGSRVLAGFRVVRYEDEEGAQWEDEIFSELRTMSLGGPVLSLERCQRAGMASTDGRFVAYTPGCGRSSPGRQEIVIRDLSSLEEPPPVVLSLPFDLSLNNLQVAGRYLAGHVWGEGADNEERDRRAYVAVYDWVDQREVYRATGEGRKGPLFDAFGLQEDGTLAYTFQADAPGTPPPAGDYPGPVDTPGGRLKLGWMSPSEPFPHVLPFEPAATGLRIAGGRILFNRRAPARQGDRPGSGFGAVVTDLKGSGVLRVIQPANDVGALGGIGFDGKHVDYVMNRCGRYRMVFDTLAAIAAHGPVRNSRCPVALPVPSTLRVGRKGDLTVPVLCRRGCDPENHRFSLRLRDRPVELSLVSLPTSRLPNGRAIRGPMGRPTHAHLRLGQKSLERVRRAKRLAIDVRVKWLDFDGRRHTRPARTTLVYRP